LAPWFRANKLSLNIKKLNFFIFQGRGRPMTHSDIQVRIYDVLIEKVDGCKFLGLTVTVDRVLSWKPQVGKVSVGF